MKWSIFSVINMFIFGVALAHTATVSAQPPAVTLPQIVLTAKHRENVTPPGATTTTRLVAVRSSNPSVATALPFRNNQVEIVAVAPGKTTVEFFDSARGQRYIQPVWVEAANATGGGGSNFGGSDKTQLNQVVMMLNRTENVDIPSNAPRISGVKSSNPSVATARTDPPRAIQVYSKAFGDTFIEFTDNTTRTVYQVHVWVTATGKLPNQGGSGGDGNKKSGNDKKVVKAPVVKPPGVVAVDPCIVGEWVSVRVRPDMSGGAGIRVSIDKFGGTEIDYSGMQPIIDGATTTTASGSAVIYLQTTNKTIMLWKLIDINVNVVHSNDGGPPFSPTIVDGWRGQPANGPYTCTKDTLTNAFQTFRRP